LPQINVTGSGGGTGPSSPIPGAQFGRFNQNLNSTIAKQAAQIEAEAKKAAREALTSTIPYMNPTILRINKNLSREIERMAKSAADEELRTLRQSAQATRRLNTLRAQEERRIQQEQERAYRASPDYMRGQNASLLGRLGQRAIDRGGAGIWEALRVNAQLGHAESMYGNSPRVMQAVAGARAHMSAAGATAGVFGRLAARPLGAFGRGALAGVEGLMANSFMGAAELGGPIGLGAYAAMKAGQAIWNAPWTMATKATGILNDAGPYWDYRKSMAAMGRAGGFNGIGAAGSWLPDKGDVPGWMRRLGMSAGDASGLIGSYGIIPRSGLEAQHAIGSIAGANLSGSLSGLGNDYLAGRGNFTSSMANPYMMTGAGSNESNLDRYLRKLQGITTIAVSQGMDRSQSIQNVEGLLRMTAAAGGYVGSGAGTINLASKMMQGGSMADRMGISASNMVQGSINAAAGFSLGSGDSYRQMVMGSYLASHGHAKAFLNDKALISIVGKTRFNELNSTDSGRQLIAQLKSAAASGSDMAVSDALSPILKGNISGEETIWNGSAFGGMQGYYANVAHDQFFGVDRTTGASYRANMGKMSVSEMDEGKSLTNRLMKDLGLTRAQAHGIVGNWMQESRLSPLADNKQGGFGIGQWQNGRLRDLQSFAAAHGMDWRDKEVQIQFAEHELKTNYAPTLAALKGTTNSYDATQVFGRGYEASFNNLSANPSNLRMGNRLGYTGQLDQYDIYGDVERPMNSVTDLNEATARGRQSVLIASRTAADTEGKVLQNNLGAEFETLQNAASKLDSAAGKLLEAADRMMGSSQPSSFLRITPPPVRLH
jgi:hypothetical protein